jgi:dynein assembly factor 1
MEDSYPESAPSVLTESHTELLKRPSFEKKESNHEQPIPKTCKPADNSSSSGVRMTKLFLKQLCKKNKLYLTPYLNDVLYLHYKGFTNIENLDEYTGLRCLWLECNGISRIENLQHLSEMRCLFLHQNLIRKIENLDGMQLLDTVNLSNNMITRLENLRNLPVLKSLQIAHNFLQSAEDIKELMYCPMLSCVDLSYNKLDDQNVSSVFFNMTQLGVLNLKGNPIVRELRNYRRSYICGIANLKHLDDRPVFPKDRACAEAWFISTIVLVIYVHLSGREEV